MRDQFSIFIILPLNILELCLSRGESDEIEKKIDPSQFLLYSASQYLLLVEQLKKEWKRWIFFVIKFASGEEFRIESCRDYHRMKNFEYIITKFLVNKYDLIVHLPQHWCTLRIDPIVKERFLTIENGRYLQNQIKHFFQPFSNNITNNSIRLLDLKFIKKRTNLIAPTIDQLQTWIINWQPSSTNESQGLIDDSQVSMKNLEEVSPFISIQNLTSLGWSHFRDPKLEQPFGLICPNCKMTYVANLYAKRCSSCRSSLIRA